MKNITSDESRQLVDSSPRNTSLSDLQSLAVRINDKHRLCVTAVRAGIEHAEKCGQLLIEAKSQVAYGEWLNWLAENIDFSARSARGYIKIARELPLLQAAEATERRPVANLDTIRGALSYLAEPREDEEDDAEPDVDVDDADPGPIQTIVPIPKDMETPKPAKTPALKTTETPVVKTKAERDAEEFKTKIGGIIATIKKLPLLLDEANRLFPAREERDETQQALQVCVDALLRWKRRAT